MVDVNVSGVIRAQPDAVFAYLADFTNWPKWQSDMQSAELVSGQSGQAGAIYRYLSKAMGQTIKGTVRITKADAPREIDFEGDWSGMVKPDGRYLVESAPGGSRVTLNPHPQTRGVGRLMSPMIGFMVRRLNREHLED